MRAHDGMRRSPALFRPFPCSMRIGWGGLIELWWLLAASASIAAGSAQAQLQQRQMSTCAPQAVGTGTVSRVLDGRSFMLDDGREIRLTSIEVPLLGASDETDARARAGRAARATLEIILAGQAVELRQSRSASDRYGRMIADAYTLEHGVQRSAAMEMLARGFARVSGQIFDGGRAAEFLANEQTARRAKLGLWAEAYYSLVPADSLSDLLAQRGHFTVVEGKVLSVRESGAIIYVNFGRRWSEALTVTIAKRSEHQLVAAGLNPRKLENMRVRVRGWVEERSGPRIEVSRPEQIELAER